MLLQRNRLLIKLDSGPYILDTATEHVTYISRYSICKILIDLMRRLKYFFFIMSINTVFGEDMDKVINLSEKVPLITLVFFFN